MGHNTSLNYRLIQAIAAVRPWNGFKVFTTARNHPTEWFVQSQGWGNGIALHQRYI